MFLKTHLLRVKLIFTLVVTLSFAHILSAQTPANVYRLSSVAQTTTDNEGILYDSGGSGNYSNNEGTIGGSSYTFNIKPSTGGCIDITIDSLGTEANFDTLTIFNGRTGELLDRISGTSTQALNFQVATDWVRVEFHSDNQTNSRGFKLLWKSLTNCTAPKATLCSSAELIPSIPFRKQSSTCNDRLDGVSASPCSNDEYLGGKDHIFKITSNGGQCLKIGISNFLTSATIGTFGRPTGINVGVYKNCPSATSGECLATGRLNIARDSVLASNVRLETPGDYYIVVSRLEACTPFVLSIDTIPCLNRLPNAGSCVKALSLNDCSAQASSDIVLDLSSKGDSTFLQVDPPSNNLGCIGGLGFVPGIDTPRYNFVFMYFKAQKDGKFGFTLSPIVADNNSDADFNVYGPIDKFSDICSYSKTNAPVRSSYGAERTVPGRSTGMLDSYVNTLGNNVIVSDTCEDGLGDGVVRTMNVKKDKFYLIWINDYRGAIGSDGVRLTFNGTTQGVLDSLNNPLSAFAAEKDTILFSGNSTTLQAQGGITYSWTPSTGLSSVNTAATTAKPASSTLYNVNIQGTCRSVTKTVKVDIFKVNKFQNTTVCKGEELTLIAGDTYPASSNAVWKWTSPSGHLSDLSCLNCSSPLFVASNTTGILEQHTYTVTLQTPQGNLSETFSIFVSPGTVAQYQVITAPKVARDSNICTGTTLSLLKTGFDATASYTWSSIPVSTISGNNPSVSPTVSTKYYVTVTGGAGGCTANSVDSVILNVFQPPVLSTIKDTSICVGASLVLGNSVLEESTTYRWSPSTGIDKIDIPNPTLNVQVGTNTYTLTATNKGNCVVTKTVKVTGVNLLMNIEGKDTILHCKGNPLTLKAVTTPSNLPVRWSSDRDFSVLDSVVSIAASPQRITRYFATISQPGCTRKDTLTVVVDSLPFNSGITPKDTAVCIGTQVIFKSPAYEPILFPNISFKWTPKKTQITSDTLYNLVISADTSVSKYYREMTNGVCKKIDSVGIVVNPIPKLMVLPKDTSLCSEDVKPITLNASADNPKATEWKWTDSNGQEIPNSKGKTTISVTPSAATNVYKVTAKIGDCPGEASATIRLLPSPGVSFPVADVICLGESTVLNTAPNSSFTYAWTSTPAGFTSTAPAPTVTPTVSTTYNVTTTSTNGCKRTQSKEIKVATGSLTVSPDTSICSGNSTALTATGTSNIGGSYKWNTGGTTATINPVITATSNYVVTFTYGSNCTLTKSIKVTAIPGFTVRISPDTFTNKLVDQGSTVTLNTTLTGNAVNPTYVWKDNDKDAGTTASITGKVLQPVHTYAVKVTSSTGCTSSAQVIVTTRFPNFEIPNAFSPNGDNINAYFNIEFDPDNKSSSFNIGNPKPRFWKGNIVVQSIQVYNRWGGKVYDESNITRLNEKTFKGWDGKNGSTDLPSDVYMYVIQLQMPDGVSKSISGELNLIR